jgi:hypothetical protein
MKKICFILGVLILCASSVKSQSQYQPYSYQFYQKLNPVLYSPDTRMHTALKPLFADDSLLRPQFDSLMGPDANSKHKSWALRKLFDEHLISTGNKDYTFYADYLPDLQIGKDLTSHKNTWINTRGFQAVLKIGDKFTFYTNLFENQAVFAPYFTSLLQKNPVIPGQANTNVPGRPDVNSFDYSYSTANLSYTPIKYLNISLAYDKNFIGDGYRSMLLSDFSINYTSFKLTGNLGNVQYMTMWTYMIDPLAPRTSPDRGTTDQYKYGVFQYLDWNISKRVSIGFFQSILWAKNNSDGTYRGFDDKYINPIIFLRPLESSDPNSPDKTHLGLTAKYKVFKNVTLYGQFLLDDFRAKEFFKGTGYWANKYGTQLGVKGFDAFGVKNLNYLAEYNEARPYTYSHFQEITSYSNGGLPLAHPFGANFKEYLTIWNYSYHRFDFMGQLNYGIYGLDENGLDYGKDIFIPYGKHANEYGNYIGQGLYTKLVYVEGRVAFVLNPKYNLRIELGGIYRKESNSQSDNKTKMFTLGLRSSFRNLYTDF